MTPLNVMTWLWQQDESRSKYTTEHVNIWADMVTRNLTTPHTISVVTNIKRGLDERINVIPLPEFHSEFDNPHWPKSKGVPQCYRRLDMFRSDAHEQYGQRFVSMDLDCVITKNIDHLFKRDDEFIITKGTSSKRPYNGSMVMLTSGARSSLYDKFTPQRSTKASSMYVGSDQAWMAYCLGWCENVWNEKDDGVWFYNKRTFDNKHLSPEKDMCIVFFAGEHKPWDTQYKWVTENYKRGV